MRRADLRVAVEELLAPRLGGDEELHRVAPVWAVEHRPPLPLLLRARDRHVVALTDTRLILFRARRWRRPPREEDVVITKRLANLGVERTRAGFPLLQVVLRTDAGRSLVLELGPLDRAVGRAIAAAIR